MLTRLDLIEQSVLDRLKLGWPGADSTKKGRHALGLLGSVRETGEGYAGSSTPNEAQTDEACWFLAKNLFAPWREIRFRPYRESSVAHWLRNPELESSLAKPPRSSRKAAKKTGRP